MKTQNQVVTEYRRLANAYDRKWSFYIEATTRETIARLSLHAEDRLLDIGCGTGALLHRLAAVHPVSRLAGVDPVPEMLEAARDKLSPARYSAFCGPAGNSSSRIGAGITWRAGCLSDISACAVARTPRSIERVTASDCSNRPVSQQWKSTPTKSTGDGGS